MMFCVWQNRVACLLSGSALLQRFIKTRLLISSTLKGKSNGEGQFLIEEWGSNSIDYFLIEEQGNNNICYLERESEFARENSGITEMWELRKQGRN